MVTEELVTKDHGIQSVKTTSHVVSLLQLNAGFPSMKSCANLCALCFLIDNY